MSVVAIVGSGPKAYLPKLTDYEAEIDIWIGADLGGYRVINEGITLDYAVGDFDSVTEKQKESILKKAIHTDAYDQMKNETDLELALNKAYEVGAKKIYLFGITGGRLDHALINVQLLYEMINKNIRGIIIDWSNKIELKKPGTYIQYKNSLYPYISFIPFTKEVKHISLSGFIYSLSNYDVTWGSTRLISNELKLEKGEYSFDEGLLLVIQSCDTTKK